MEPSGKPDRSSSEGAQSPSLALRASEDQFRLLVESVVDYAIFLLEPDGTIASWNAGARRINGYRDEEIIGEHFSVLHTPEDFAREHSERELEAAAAHGRYEEEGWRVRKDGSRLWASVVITALRDEDGQHVGFAKVTHDLSERQLAERRLHDATEDLRRSHDELQDFASAVAHDLRAPLQVIGGFAELLERRHGETLDEEAVDLVGRIRANVDHINDLIDALLTYSLAGRKPLAVERVDAGEALRTVLEVLGTEIASSGAEIRVGELPTLAADRVQLVQVLQNLIANAIKFSDAPPRIEVSAEREDGAWHLQVRDEGVGIAPEDFERIFRMFERVGDHPGTGVGLATCKRIVERHGGRIWVESEPGAGSTFHFTWSEPDGAQG